LFVFDLEKPISPSEFWGLDLYEIWWGVKKVIEKNKLLAQQNGTAKPAAKTTNPKFDFAYHRSLLS
jgi:hypothetical protein